MLNELINNKYFICEKIGSGSFGTIYKGMNKRTNEYVAIKVEPIHLNLKLLQNECKIYNYLSDTVGIPKVKWYGKDDTNYYMVLNLLGSSLQNIINDENKLSLTNVLQLGIIIFNILKNIHNKGLIHRDIKPDNFLLDLNKKNLYLIDFGLCKPYLKNNKHIEIKVNKNIIGSYNFASINSHNYLELSRRDDLESSVYMMMYLYYGRLEWQNINSLDIYEKNKVIKLMKENIQEQENIDIIFRNLLKIIRKLSFDETPNYQDLVIIIKKYIDKSNY